MVVMTEQRNETVPTCWPLAMLWAAATLVLRIVPHPQNFAAMGALSLYGGARMPLWAGLVLPLATMAGADLVLWYVKDYKPFNPVVYGCFIVTVLLGTLLRRTNSVWKIGAAAIASDVLFFLVTNFAAWRGDHGHAYATTIDGLWQSYVAAIPFHQWTAISTLLFVPLFFGVHTLATKPETAGEHAS